MSTCQSFNPEFFPGITKADPHVLMVKELDTGDVHMHQGKDGCVVVRARDIAQVARMLELCARAAENSELKGGPQPPKGELR